MSSKRRFRKDRDPESTRLPAQVIGLGLNVVAAAFLFGFAGHWIGTKIGGEDILALLGGLLGAAAGFYSLVIHLNSRPREDREDEKNTR